MQNLAEINLKNLSEESPLMKDNNDTVVNTSENPFTKIPQEIYMEYMPYSTILWKLSSTSKSLHDIIEKSPAGKIAKSANDIEPTFEKIFNEDFCVNLTTLNVGVLGYGVKSLGGMALFTLGISLGYGAMSSAMASVTFALGGAGITIFNEGQNCSGYNNTFCSNISNSCTATYACEGAALGFECGAIGGLAAGLPGSLYHGLCTQLYPYMMGSPGYENLSIIRAAYGAYCGEKKCFSEFFSQKSMDYVNREMLKQKMIREPLSNPITNKSSQQTYTIVDLDMNRKY